ncbi:AraC family transcriptional regulato [Halomicronema hongdechloris C2206]|uniref:AraC family transcriptional regulato n=1 Tax=Halomicronema hongdechloris C2206 TaxID=1641165 RepID=A0A1Z3HII5_9CYAN|nr:helix-turn-helix domain-containing protein [Halomicronema hongdechloris]ASC70134.1 AraC family transcriptional regulato [Halomicronema hongdechloris C2206]
MSNQPLHISLLTLPDAMLSTLSGIYDVLNSFSMLSTYDDQLPKVSPFQVEIAGAGHLSSDTASGQPVRAERAIVDIDHTDIVIVPSVMVAQGQWQTGRYPEVVDWLKAMYAQGATLCSACSGVLLLAETGLLDGKEATMHWAYATTFRQNFPNIQLKLEKVLVIAGEREQFVMSGASSSWHDLVLYLVAHHAGPHQAQAIAKFFALQWHIDGQAPYLMFRPTLDHDDALMREAQLWLDQHFAIATPVAEMTARSGLSERSFKRRFDQATGYSPIAYVQHLRVEAAKQQLEQTSDAIEQISYNVGYEDAASFRRLFKRLTEMTPGAYRRKFSLPEFAHK